MSIVKAVVEAILNMCPEDYLVSNYSSESGYVRFQRNPDKFEHFESHNFPIEVHIKEDIVYVLEDGLTEVGEISLTHPDFLVKLQGLISIATHILSFGDDDRD